MRLEVGASRRGAGGPGRGGHGLGEEGRPRVHPAWGVEGGERIPETRGNQRRDQEGTPCGPQSPSPREDGALSARGRASPGPAPWPLGVGLGSFP